MKSTDISSVMGEKEEKEVNMLPTKIIYWSVLIFLYIAFICVVAYQWPPDSFVTVFNQVGEYTRDLDVLDYPSRFMILVLFPIITIKQMYPYMIADPTLKKKEKSYEYVPPINNKVETKSDSSDDSGNSFLKTYFVGEMFGLWK